MGLLDNMIKKAVSDAMGSAVKKAVQPAADAAAQKAADSIAQAAQASAQAAQAAQTSAQAATQAAAQTAAQSAAQAATQAAANAAQSSAAAGGTDMPSQAELESAFSMLGQLMQGAADSAAKNMKVCPQCGEAAEADEAFCPKCGGKLPEITVSQSYTCAKCGKQNKLGQRFCTGCGEKLPAALMEEQAQAEKDAKVIGEEWQEKLPEYPVWSCGGNDYGIDVFEEGRGIMFACMFPTGMLAEQAVRAYREVLKAAGFRQEGKYKSDDHLYKKVNGVSCHVDTEHCFEGDAESPCIYFNHEEPTGGYNYQPPPQQPKKPGGLFGALFG